MNTCAWESFGSKNDVGFNSQPLITALVTLLIATLNDLAGFIRLPITETRGISANFVGVYLGSLGNEGLLTLRVQVPNNQILTQDLYYNYYYPNP